MTPAELDARDRAWLANVYQGDHERQLTVRAVFVGMLLGSVMSLSNLYSGLKIGWSFGASITSAIIAFALFTALRRVPRVAGAVVFALLAVGGLYFIYPIFAAHAHMTVLGMIARCVPTILCLVTAGAFWGGTFQDDFTLLENNTMQTTASAAGAMASAGLLSAIPALTLLSQRGANGEAPVIHYPATLTPIMLMAWLAAVSYLGVMSAVPLKRQFINIEELPFPSGTACAVTLKSMHTAGLGAIKKARALLYAGILGVIVKAFTGLTGWLTTLPDNLYLAPRWHFLRRPGAPRGVTLENLTIGLPVSVLLLGGGALIGMRIALSLGFGAILNYLVIAPLLHKHGIINAGRGYGAIRAWALWPGTAMMVTSGIMAFALKWRTIGRAFSGLGRAFSSKAGAPEDPLAKTEVPATWFMMGLVLAGFACVVLQAVLFGITWWMGIIAVFATLLLSLVAARATGETDVTPTGAMGKITQLIYGVIVPTNVTTNLMTANVTAGAASHSADLLTDLKTGYLVGASARRQFIAQLFGVLSGALLSVPVYNLIANPRTLGSQALPAPAAVAWASVARLFRGGLHALPRGTVMAMVIAGSFGILIAVLEEVLPRYKKYMPSPTGIGIAFYIAASDSFAMCLGAVLAWWVKRLVTESKKAEAQAKAELAATSGVAPTPTTATPDSDEDEGAAAYIVPVSSGLIAGESLMGIVVAALNAFHILGE